MNETQRPESEGVGRGVGLGILFNIAYAGLWCALWFGLQGDSWLASGFGESLFFWSLFCIGATQLLYILPAILYFRWRGRPGVVKGLIIAAAVMLLLNGTCWMVLKS